MAHIRAGLSGRWVFLALLQLLLIGPLQAEEMVAPPPPPDPPDYNAMADLLADQASRDRLIAELRALASETGSAGAEASVGGVLKEGLDIPLSAPMELAAEARDFLTDVSGEFAEAAKTISTINFSERSGTLENFLAAGFSVGVAGLICILVYTLAHRLLHRVNARAGGWVAQGTGRSRILRHLVSALVPLFTALLTVGLAWVCGYLAMRYLLPPEGGISRGAKLFLNAFLVVETIRVIMEGLLVPRYPKLRLLPLQSASAGYWNRWLGWLIGFVGYGLLLAYPLVNENFSPAMAQTLALAVMLLGYLTIVALILRNRKRVRAGMLSQSHRAAMGFTRLLLGALARAWHVLAILYFTILVLVAINEADEGLRAMADATVQTLIAVGLGGLLSSTLTRLMGRRARLPVGLRQWSPALERHLNQYLPTWMKVIRVVITIIVIAVVLDAWALFDLQAWAESEMGIWVMESALTVGLIVTGAALLWIFATSWIEHRLNSDGASAQAHARERTLLGLFRNAIAIVILVVTLMIVLSELGINIAPLLASAGVLGLAIGFGAQKLVQDIITGIFIQLENAINTGDVVTVGGYSGEAEKITIRSLGLRDLAGTYHIIPFSSVDTVSNFMRGFSYHLGEYGVAYRENTDDALVHLQAAFDDLKQNPEQSPFILGDLEVDGVTQLGDSAITLRVRIKTLPGKQWGVGREYNRLVKKHFDAAGIEIPYPHMTLYFGQDKNGKAPPAPIAVVDDETGRLEPSRDGKRLLVEGDAERPDPQSDRNVDDTEGR